MIEGVKRVLKTRQHLFMYTGSGHAAWEASLVNLFSPGDAVLIPETGHFSVSWANMARDLGLEVREVPVADTGAVAAALEGADVALLESPTNPLLEVADRVART